MHMITACDYMEQVNTTTNNNKQNTCKINYTFTKIQFMKNIKTFML